MIGGGGRGGKISSTDLVKLRCWKHALRHHDNKMKWTGRLATTLSTKKADPIAPRPRAIPKPKLNKDTYYSSYPSRQHLCLSVPVCAYLCLSVAVCACLCLYVPVCAFLCLSVPVCGWLCLSVPICAYLCLSVPICACLCLYVAICACLCLSVPLRPATPAISPSEPIAVFKRPPNCWN